MARGNIFDLFDETIEYPDGGMLIDGVPLGTSYCYVSSAYLNGFINYGTVVFAAICQRYCRWDSDERFSEGAFLAFENSPHSNLDALPDDAIIWTEVADIAGSYVFFWYDRDCSDCCIGRIAKRTISPAGLSEMTRKWISGNDNFVAGRYREIKLNGWISG